MTSLSVPVDRKLVKNGHLTLNTRPSELLTPTTTQTPVVTVDSAGNCQEASSFVAGKETGTKVDLYGGGLQNGRCTGSVFMTDLTFNNGKRGVEFGYSDRAYNVEVTDAKTPTGDFDFSQPTSMAQYLGSSVVTLVGRRTQSFPNVAKQFPELPFFGRLRGDETVGRLVAKATVLDPAVNEDAKAWATKIGDVSRVWSPADGPPIFYDLNGSGKVGAYVLKARGDAASVLDLISGGKVVFRVDLDQSANSPSLRVAEPVLDAQTGLPTGDDNWISRGRNWVRASGGPGAPDYHTDFRTVPGRIYNMKNGTTARYFDEPIP